MNCRLVDPALDQIRQTGDIPPDLRSHIEQCLPCRAIYDWMLADPRNPEVPPAEVQGIAQSMAGLLRAVEPLPPPPITILRILAMLMLLALIFIARMGTAGIGHMHAAQIVIVSALVLAGTCVLSTSLSWQMRPGSYQRFRAAAGIAWIGIGVAAVIGLFFPWHRDAGFFSMGWQCLKGGLAIAVGSAVLLWLLARRGACLSAPTLGATLGAAGGLLGFTVLQLQCPYQEAPHLLVFHGGALALSTFFGWWIARVAGRLVGSPT